MSCKQSFTPWKPHESKTKQKKQQQHSMNKPTNKPTNQTTTELAVGGRGSFKPINNTFCAPMRAFTKITTQEFISSKETQPIKLSLIERFD